MLRLVSLYLLLHTFSAINGFDEGFLAELRRKVSKKQEKKKKNLRKRHHQHLLGPHPRIRLRPEPHQPRHHPHHHRLLPLPRTHDAPSLPEPRRSSPKAILLILLTPFAPMMASSSSRPHLAAARRARIKGGGRRESLKSLDWRVAPTAILVSEDAWK